MHGYTTTANRQAVSTKRKQFLITKLSSRIVGAGDDNPASSAEDSELHIFRPPELE